MNAVLDLMVSLELLRLLDGIATVVVEDIVPGMKEPPTPEQTAKAENLFKVCFETPENVRSFKKMFLTDTLKLSEALAMAAATLSFREGGVVLGDNQIVTVNWVPSRTKTR